MAGSKKALKSVSVPKRSLSAKALKVRATNKSTPKKTTIKKTPARKPSLKKVEAKKVLKKTSVKKKVTEKLPKKEKITAPIVAEVTIPSNVSLRAKSKVQALEELVNEHFAVSMYRIAYVSAVCFILVGITLLIPGNSRIISNQTAQLCTSVNCQTTQIASGTTSNGIALIDTTLPTGSETPTAPTQLVQVEPTMKVLDVIPDVIQSDTRVALQVSAAESVTVTLQAITAGGLFSAKTEKVTNSNYRFTIPAATLPAGEYSIKVFVKAASGSGTYSFPGGRFTVPANEVTKEVTNDTSSTSIQSSGDIVSTSTATKTETSSNTTPDVVKNDESEETEYVEEIAFKPAVVNAEVPFSLIIARAEFKGMEAVRVTAPDNVNKVELYLNPELSLQSRFLGSAQKNFDQWLHIFDSQNIPDGVYKLYAIGYAEGKELRTESRTVQISNKGTVTITEPVNAVKRDFYTYTPDEEFENKKTVNDEVVNEVKTLLADNRTEFNSLLEKYAMAVQSDNEVLQQKVSEEISKYRERMVTKSLFDDATKDVAYQIDEELQEQVAVLKNRVETFETIRRSRNSVNIGADSDSDGISDFDEINFYITDPNNPDTDGDGFLDGAEVAGGFDPTDAVGEVVITYELPKEIVGLTRPELLEIKTVLPLIEKDTSLNTPEVQAEITGIGLPNSFATIYIFSTPTIVTVKTDEDGSFVYTFDKELEDGEHEVYVAFTDNTGAILAQSNPFRFVKEAQAFTPVDASKEVIIATEPLAEVVATNTYNVVFGMGILALGLILLLLGISIRPENTAEIKTVSA